MAYIFNWRTKLRIVWVRDPIDKVDKGARQHDEIIRLRVDASPSQVRGHGAHLSLLSPTIEHDEAIPTVSFSSRRVTRRDSNVHGLSLIAVLHLSEQANDTTAYHWPHS